MDVRVGIRFEPRGLWIGLYWDRLPTLPILLALEWDVDLDLWRVGADGQPRRAR